MTKFDDAKIGTDALKSFAEQFGPDDVYTRIIIEVLLEELFKKQYNTEVDSKEIKNGYKSE